jgi:hypothetical protein
VAVVVVTPLVVLVVDVAVEPAIALTIAAMTDAGGLGGVTPLGTKATVICALEPSETELGSVVSVGFDDSSVGQYAISTCPTLPASRLPRGHVSPFE